VSTCPSPEVLRRFESSISGDPNDSRLNAHINGCSACQVALNGLMNEESPTTIPAGAAIPTSKDLPQLPGFEIERELGRGGMGVVYLARELKPNRPVAIKFLASGPLAVPSDRERWLKEARAAARVRHPHVVQLHHADEAEGWLYLVLEYLPGGSLKERLPGPLPPRVAATLLTPIARALAELHCAGIWHLDLKPANILVDGSPGTPLDRATLKLTDFGIARSSDQAHTTGSARGAVPGTPRYMAPEQVDGQHSALGPATDIHAMGILLYELLSGRPPFLADSGAETMQRVRTDDPLPPRRLNPGIPRDLETICLKCLAKEPRQRYGSAETLAADLQGWLEGRSISARPVSAWEKSWKRCRRRPVVAGLVVSLATTLICGFLASLVLWRYAEAQRSRAESDRTLAMADHEVSRAVLSEIVNIGAASLEPTVVVTRDRIVASLQAARPRLGELHERRPHDRAIWILLANVDLILGRNLEYQGQWREAEARFRDALERWDKVVGQAPAELAPTCRRWQTLECLGRVLDRQQKVDQAVSCFERAVAAGEAFLKMRPIAELDFGSLMDCRMHLATLVERQGDRERASVLLEANLQLWKILPEHVKTPAVAARIDQCRIELSRIACELATGSEEEWATRAANILRSLQNAEAGGAAELSEVGYSLQRSFGMWASYLRRSGDLDRSSRIVNRMHRLGRLLVSMCPDRSASYLACTEACYQSAKEAFQSNDPAEARVHWQLGLDAARQAVSADPEDSRARKTMADLASRLKNVSLARLAQPSN
jgi:serine/threonine protein kinase/tetratricopeptide (TPR) repeat protein